MQEVYKDGEMGEVEDFSIEKLQESLKKAEVDSVRVFDKKTEDKTTTIKVTETTVKALLKAIGEAKSLKMEVAIVKSEYSNIVFEIVIETTPFTQESIGYRLKE